MGTPRISHCPSIMLLAGIIMLWATAFSSDDIQACLDNASKTHQENVNRCKVKHDSGPAAEKECLNGLKRNHEARLNDCSNNSNGKSKTDSGAIKKSDTL